MMAAGANVSLLPYAPLGISFPLAIPFPPPLGGGTVTWPKKQRQYQAPLIYTVILWYSFVVQSPPPPMPDKCVCGADKMLVLERCCMMCRVVMVSFSNR